MKGGRGAPVPHNDKDDSGHGDRLELFIFGSVFFIYYIYILDTTRYTSTNRAKKQKKP